jgi:SEC-C motif-containing protein
MMKANRHEACPCGSGRPFAGCCEPYLDHADNPATAEALMRSRYTAYSLGRLDYVRATWHPKTCPSALQPVAGLRWLGLQIRRVQAGGENDVTGIVEFVARSKLGGRAERLHETSTFERVDGRWMYRHGELRGEPSNAPPRG